MSAAKHFQKYLNRLFPICRSITGQGNRQTLNILNEIIPIDIKEVPSGKKVYDWVIPDEWNINNAWIKTADGTKIIDFKKNNLHVVSYSTPINKSIDWNELKPHLNTHDKMPNAIP